MLKLLNDYVEMPRPEYYTVWKREPKKKQYMDMLDAGFNEVLQACYDPSEELEERVKWCSIQFYAKACQAWDSQHQPIDGHNILHPLSDQLNIAVENVSILDLKRIQTEIKKNPCQANLSLLLELIHRIKTRHLEMSFESIAPSPKEVSVLTFLESLRDLVKDAIDYSNGEILGEKSKVLRLKTIMKPDKLITQAAYGMMLAFAARCPSIDLENLMITCPWNSESTDRTIRDEYYKYRSSTARTAPVKNKNAKRKRLEDFEGARFLAEQVEPSLTSLIDKEINEFCEKGYDFT